MKREIYATDGQYYLMPLAPEDKEDYMNLRQQITEMPFLYSTPELLELVWSASTELGDINYSIFDSNHEYCGNVILQNPKADIPEIGVDLIETKRNQGIAEKAIKLLARKAYEELEVDYFLLRVSSRNSHSRHMIEKLGAVLIGEEEGEFTRMIRTMREVLDEDSFAKIGERIPSLLDKSDDEKEEIVFRYQLTPNMFKR